MEIKFDANLMGFLRYLSNLLEILKSPLNLTIDLC